MNIPEEDQKAIDEAFGKPAEEKVAVKTPSGQTMKMKVREYNRRINKVLLILSAAAVPTLGGLYYFGEQDKKAEKTAIVEVRPVDKILFIFRPPVKLYSKTPSTPTAPNITNTAKPLYPKTNGDIMSLLSPYLNLIQNNQLHTLKSSPSLL